MTKEAIKKRMDEIERGRWILNLKDRWTRADRDWDDKMLREWIDLNRQLKELEA